MKSTGIKTTLLAICTTLICGLFPVLSVSADNLQMPYIALPYSFINTSNNTLYGMEVKNVNTGVVDNNADVRCVMLYEGTESSPTWKQNRCITNQRGLTVHYYRDSTEGGGGNSAMSNEYVVDNETYYYTSLSSNVDYWFNHLKNVGGLVNVTGTTSAEKRQAVYDYTFGAQAVTPMQVGALMNVSLSTRYVNEQKNYSSQNLDVISWYGYQDNNYNDITGIEWFVDIRARKISYSGTSATDLLSRLQNEAVFSDDYFNIASVSAKKGDYSLTWGEVYNAFDISALQMFESESLFYTYGWVYEIRLRNADTEDLSEWQTIYTLSSLPPQSTTDFGNNVGFNSTATEIIYKVDTQNMNTSTNYNVTYNFYNDIPIGSDDYQQDVNGKPWYIILLEGITGLVQKIIDIIGGVMHDIITGIFDFITDIGVNIVDTFKNIFNGFNTNLDTFNDNLNDVELPQTTTEGITTLKDLIQIPFTILNDSGLSIFIWIPLALCILGVLL